MCAERINNIKVKPVVIPKTPVENIKGHQLFETLYSNIFLLARKNSGKSTVIYNILRHSVNRNTTVLIFSSTCERDPTYDAIRQMLSKKRVPVVCQPSIYEGKNNLISEFMEMARAFRSETDEEKNEKEPQPPPLCNFPTTSIPREQKPRVYKPKKLAPEYIIILDDLGRMMRDGALAQLLKTNRHFRSRVILSGQNLHDLSPEEIRQLDYLLVFRSLSQDKISRIHTLADIGVDNEHFSNLYEQATRQPYSFLYIDVRNDTFRQNFNIRLT